MHNRSDYDFDVISGPATRPPPPLPSKPRPTDSAPLPAAPRPPVAGAGDGAKG